MAPPTYILHTCDNAPCCNPQHLYAGSDADNVADRDSRRRRTAPKGSQHGRARLTEQDVMIIRSSDSTVAHLARQYSVGESTIRHIIQRNTWTHI